MRAGALNPLKGDYFVSYLNIIGWVLVLLFKELTASSWFVLDWLLLIVCREI